MMMQVLDEEDSCQPTPSHSCQALRPAISLLKGAPISVMFLTPGVTPWKTTLPGVVNGSNNPGIRVFEYDRATLSLQVRGPGSAGARAGGWGGTECFTVLPNSFQLIHSPLEFGFRTPEPLQILQPSQVNSWSPDLPSPQITASYLAFLPLALPCHSSSTPYYRRH